MKIKAKDLDDLKAQIVAKFNGYKAKGKSEEVAKTLTETWIEENEFEDAEGTILKAGIELLESEPTDPGADAIGKAVAKAIEPLLTAMDRKGNGGNTRTPEIKTSDPIERMFMDSTDPTFKTWGFRNIGDFASSLYQYLRPTGKHLDSRLDMVMKGADAFRRGVWKATPTTYASEIVGADGGFLVPPEYRQEIWTAITAQSEFLNRIDLTPTSSNTVNMNVDENAPWDNTSGIKVYWRQQAVTMSQSKPIFQNRQVQLNELYALVPATDELLADAPMLNNHLGVKAPQKMTWQIDEAIIRGTGQGEPLGMLENNPSLITVTCNSTSSAGFSITDMANMYPRVIPPMNVNDVPAAIWLMGQRTYPYTSLMGTSSTVGFPLALVNQNIEGRIITTAFGMPIVSSLHAPGFDQLGAVSLINFQGYKGFNKQDGFDFQSSIHLFFDAGATALRWRYRFGGQPMLKSTLTAPNDTGLTMSHAVVLSATL